MIGALQAVAGVFLLAVVLLVVAHEAGRRAEQDETSTPGDRRPS